MLDFLYSETAFVAVIIVLLFMYVVCLLFYAIGSFCFSIFLILYLSFSFP